MNHSLLSIKAVALIALAAVVGVIVAGPLQPDLSAAWQFVMAHGDVTATMLAFGPLVRSLEEKRAGVVKSMSDMLAAAEAADRDLNDDEKTRFEALKAENEGLKARIARAQEQELAEAGLGKPAAAAAAAQLSSVQTTDHGRAVTIGAAQILGTRENVESDPNRGFVHVGDFARSLVGAALVVRNGGQMDRRLAGLMGEGGPVAGAASTFANESVGADGGFLVPPSFARTIFGLSLEENALLPMTDNMPVEGNGMSFPKDETTPWGSNGVRAYWQGEGTAGVPTKPVLGTTDLKLKKLMALVPVTNELLADVTALAAWIPPNCGRSIRWKTDEAVLFGNGAGLPFGAFFSPGTGQGPVITVAKESGQTTATLLPVNLAKMIARLMPGSYGRAVWIINNDVLPALFTMTLGNYPIYLPAGAPVGGIQNSPYGSLLGRPIIVSQHANTFSSLGDVMLADMSYYQSITKTEGVTMATSMHLYFDADTMAFRATFRVDGIPKLSAPVTPAKGSNTLSPFVQLEAR